ncbi:MAG: hypothetical protein QOD75_1857 [Blastocatellia bacterium]|jgi:hypothetical protein|nr:hypothetical protein [Blastocatellia bacterium]
MHAPTSQEFIKKSSCPPEFEIVLFLSDALPAARSRLVLRHLRTCEFCDAEAKLLAHYSPESEHIETPLMPRPLRLLAESLLVNRFPALDDLTRLDYEINVLG